MCMAMEALGALRLGAQAKGPGFSWDEACSCCAIRGMNEGEVWASIGRLMVSGYLHAGPDFAFLRLCPSPDDDDPGELRQALSGARLGDRSAVGAWMCACEYSGWAVALMEKNAGKEDRARARVYCALGDLRRAWRNPFFVRH